MDHRLRSDRSRESGNGEARMVKTSDDARRELPRMTPSRYKAVEAGVPIRYGLAGTSLGWLLAAATDRGICMIVLGDSPGR